MWVINKKLLVNVSKAIRISVERGTRSDSFVVEAQFDGGVRYILFEGAFNQCESALREIEFYLGAEGGYTILDLGRVT